jgi:hypothetical protein
MHNQGHNGANGQGGQEGEALAVQRLRRTALGLVGVFLVLCLSSSFHPLPLSTPSPSPSLVCTANTRTDTYASYFTTRAPDALLPPLQYVLGALADPDAGICLAVRFCLRFLSFVLSSCRGG